MTKYVLMLSLCLATVWLRAQNPTGMINPDDTKMTDTAGQKDLIGLGIKWFHIHPHHPTKVDGKRVYYSVLPLTTSVPGGGSALITSTNAGFYLGNRRHTYISNVTFSPSINLQGQFVLPFRSNIWLENNTWNFQGDARFSIYPQYTWGMGGKQPEDSKILVKSKYIRFNQYALKRIRPWLLAGIGFNMDYHVGFRPDIDSINVPTYTKYKYGTQNNTNSYSSGFSFNFLYDTRTNSLNPLPGLFANIIYRINPAFMTKGESWNSLYLDMRKYITMGPGSQNVLAIWTYFWTVLGSHAPYLDLPSIGWDSYQRSGRGFYVGRYVGRSLYYLETEYRRNITDNGLFGFVVFANLNSVTETYNSQFAYLHPGGGTGLRIKFNRNSGSNIGVDLGVSKGRSAIYINLGEYF